MRVIIVGGGWSGLAAAIELSQHRCDISLFEASNVLGGRARSVPWQDIAVDNGQHLMLGAYQQMLNLMQQIELDPSQVFSREALDLVIVDPRYPALNIRSSGIFPKTLNRLFNLWKSTGLQGVTAIGRLQRHLHRGQSDPTMTVANLLKDTRQPQRLIDQLWEPLTLAMLNTPIIEASAQVFANVLQASLFAGDQATELLIPKRPLNEIFPLPTANYLQQKGVLIHTNNRVQALLFEDEKLIGVRDQHGQSHLADAVILALPPAALKKLLPTPATISPIDEYPICTVYLQYDAALRAPQSMMGFSGTLTQWLFDRSFQRAGLMAVVISGPGTHMQLSKTELAAVIVQELADLLPDWPQNVENTLVIREKRATYACTPATQQHRPHSQTCIENLWLAGDFVNHPFPATLETAISNGQRCAQQILQIA